MSFYLVLRALKFILLFSISSKFGFSQSIDTLRHTIISLDQEVGERKYWKENGTHFFDFRANHRSFLSKVKVNEFNFPISYEIIGNFGPNEWMESFYVTSGGSIWKTSIDSGKIDNENTFYIPIAPVAKEDLLAPYLIEIHNRVSIIPKGTGRIEKVKSKKFTSGDLSIQASLYAIHGIDLFPQYVWLDENHNVFANSYLIRKTFEQHYQEALAEIRTASNNHLISIFKDLTNQPFPNKLVIHDVNVFDPEERKLQHNKSVIIENGLITSVQPSAKLTLKSEGDIIDGKGMTLVAGLWDMHIHTFPENNDPWLLPIQLAQGITTLRDLGNDKDYLINSRKMIANGQLPGPDIVPAVLLGKKGFRNPSAHGEPVGTLGEIEQILDEYQNLGFVQVKLYNSLDKELVPEIIEAARNRGMRISGHIPNSYTGAEFVREGIDEIQHMLYVLKGSAGFRNFGEPNVTNQLLQIVPESEQWQSFKELLIKHNIVIDPTLALQESLGVFPPKWLSSFPSENLTPVAYRALLDENPPPMPFMSLNQHKKLFEHSLLLLKDLYDSGITIVPGTDLSGSFALIRELEIYTEAGIPDAEVLAMATMIPAEIMGMSNLQGAVKEGMKANLILVDGNPADNISDLRNISFVIKDGKIYKPESIFDIYKSKY